MNDRLWRAAHQLAAELAQRDFDNNVLKAAADYIQTYPDADLEDWLDRLVRLGDAFRSSNNTRTYRHELQQAVTRLRPKPASGQQWANVLAWAARLRPYYYGNISEARAVSDVWSLRLPTPPAPWQMPQEAPEQAQMVEEDLPEVRDEVDPLANMFMDWLKNKGDE